MALLEKQFSAFFNSAGSSKLGNLGNRFEVALSTPLTIPPTCIYATLEVISAKVWNTSPNISNAIGNNHLHFSYLGTPYDIEFADGIWNTEQMNLFITTYFVYHGIKDDLFEIVNNDATQRVSIRMKLGVEIDFTQPGSCSDVLGFYTTHNVSSDTFTSDIKIKVDVDGHSVSAPFEARFNRVVHYYIRSNLTSDGIPINNVSSGVICEVPIPHGIAIGSLITFIPTNPLRSDATDLIGKAKTSIKFTLVDQLGRDVSTSDEDWSLSIMFRYWDRISL
jgi:hypothetical protein